MRAVFAQRRLLLRPGLALRLPNTVTDEAAASLTIKGFTACMLLRRFTLYARAKHC